MTMADLSRDLAISIPAEKTIYGNGSVSSLELAKGFDAPLLKDVDTNSTSTELLDQVPKWSVRYGENHGTDQAERRMPTGRHSGDESMRVVIADARITISPRDGILY
jgi:hypothetical protein